jgi:hypothetical protein
VRRSLIDALVAGAERSLQYEARRFLLGLSFDELLFLAEFPGGATVDCASCRSEDQELKVIVLREYSRFQPA